MPSPSSAVRAPWWHSWFPAARPRPARRARPELELLENRWLPSTSQLLPVGLPSFASDPEQFTVVGPSLFFVANDGAHGSEL